MKPELQLSLQFAREPSVKSHREVLSRSRVIKWLKVALPGPAEVTVRVVGEAEGRALNREYRGKDYATNVLTFDYEIEPVVMADLVLCADVVEREAQEQGRTLEQHYAHLLIHGALHAQGHDHEDDDEAALMETIESRLMIGLGFPDPYAF